jgi:hypothetical protein
VVAEVAAAKSLEVVKSHSPLEHRSKVPRMGLPIGKRQKSGRAGETEWVIKRHSSALAPPTHHTIPHAGGSAVSLTDTWPAPSYSVWAIFPSPPATDSREMDRVFALRAASTPAAVGCCSTMIMYNNRPADEHCCQLGWLVISALSALGEDGGFMVLSNHFKLARLRMHTPPNLMRFMSVDILAFGQSFASVAITVPVTYQQAPLLTVKKRASPHSSSQRLDKATPLPPGGLNPPTLCSPAFGRLFVPRTVPFTSACDDGFFPSCFRGLLCYHWATAPTLRSPESSRARSHGLSMSS